MVRNYQIAALSMFFYLFKHYYKYESLIPLRETLLIKRASASSLITQFYNEFHKQVWKKKKSNKFYWIEKQAFVAED